MVCDRKQGSTLFLCSVAKTSTALVLNNVNLVSDTDKFTFAKATQLPGVLENEARSLENEQNQLKKEKASREKQFWLYFQVGREVVFGDDDLK